MPRKRRIHKRRKLGGVCKKRIQQKRKVYGGKRRIHRRRRRGGAFSDYLPKSLSQYIPSASKVLSYVPGYSTAKGYYDTAVGAYNTGKKYMKLIKK
jgi:hypothetical protein